MTGGASIASPGKRGPVVGRGIVLTETRVEDKEALFRWINDPATVRYNAPYRPVGWDSHSAWFGSLGANASRVEFAIRRRDAPEIIGMLQLLDIHPVHRSAELVIRIGEQQNRGMGYGSEAVRLALDFAWNDLNLNRVWLRVFAINKRAIRAYEKAGMEQEGRMRKAAFIDGDWLDEIIMAALRP
jgi:RimJ/RimL family protein N-acetyltransferase